MAARPQRDFHILVVVSFTNNVAALSDGATFDTSKMLVSRARLAVGFGIIDRRLAFYAPDPDWAADLNGDRLRAVMNSPYDDDFMTEASRCFDHWNQQLISGGVAVGSIDHEQRAALLVLLNEHSLGIGPPDATFDVLVDLAAQNVDESRVFSQFHEAYAGLVGTPVDSPGFVPTTQRCARL